MRLNRYIIWVAAVILLAGCSTHYLLEADTLMLDGHVKVAAEQYERAAKGDNKQEALEKLVPIYYQINEHEKSLSTLNKLEEIMNLSTEMSFQKGEALMALGRYEEAKEIYEGMSRKEFGPLIDTRLKTLESISQRQADSIYYKVNPVKIISTTDEVASAAMPRRVGNDLYFTVESPRTTRIGKDAFVDDYTGHRMLDLWKGELVDSLEREGEVFIFGDPAPELNTIFHDGVVSYSKGSNVGVISKTYVSEDPIFMEQLTMPAGNQILHEVQLYNSRLELDSLGSSTWVTGDRMSFCEEGYMYAHPVLSPDGENLFFTSDMPGGYGGMDIWVAKKKDSTWVNPVNLGPVINTRGDEAFPSMRHVDTLFFSSTGHMGLGGLDIVYATGHNGSYGKVYTDLPPPINSSRDDFGVLFDESGMSGLFTSDRTEVDALYKFYNYEPQIELIVEFIHKGDKSPWPGIEAVLECVSDSTLENFIGDEEGRWSTIVDREKTFMIQCPNSFGYTADPFITPEDQTIHSITRIIEIPMIIEVGCMDSDALNYNSLAIVSDNSCIYEIPAVLGCTEEHACNYNAEATENDGSCEYVSCITVEEKEKFETIIEEAELAADTLESVSVNLYLEWDYDEAFVRSKDKAAIARFATYMIANPETRVLLTSHCDSRATKEYNDRLSQARASAAKAEILSHGIDESRVVSFGGSEQFPIHDCPTEECSEEEHQENRRTTATFLKYNEDVVIHRVKSGESIYSISRKYGISEGELKEWNELKTDDMRIGQELKIHISR